MDYTNSAGGASQQAGEKLLIILAVTLVISVMNATMFTVALPTISAEFMLTAAQVSWIMTGYIIVYAVGSAIYGKLADKYRLKDLLTIGLSFFALGSIIGLMATEYWMIVGGRVFQAAGAAVIPAAAMIIPVRYFSQEMRGRALGIVSSGMALGGALGPIFAGVITGAASWRLLFLLSLLPLLTLPFYRKYLCDDHRKEGKTDFLGGLLLAGSVAVLLLSITKGNWVLSIAGIALLGLFVFRIYTAQDPFIRPTLLQNRNYSAGILIAFLSTGLNFFGVPFIIPLMLTNINKLEPIMIGLIMFPGALIAALLGRKGGKLADEKGNVFLVYTAAALLFLSFSFLSLSAGMSAVIIMLLLISCGVGQIFMQIAMSNTVSQTLSKEQTGVGMGLFMMLNFISGATATTLIGKILDLGHPTFQLNPFLVNKQALSYSNIFAVLSIMLIVVLLAYKRQFGSNKEII